MLQVDFSELTDTGRVRDHNEDYVGHVEPVTASQAQSHGWLFVVADGVGGQDLGEVASRVAVESLVSNFRKSVGGESHTGLLRRMVQAANQAVYEAGRAASPGGVSMSTTVVACSLRYDRLTVAHVGDSRAYLIRRGNATILTKDHTVTAEQVRMGLVSAKEASESAHRHLLSRSLGGDLFVNVDTADHQVVPGDILLLCTDGLHNAVTESDIGNLLRPDVNLSEAANKLVALANNRDGGDNITVQLVRIRAVERVGLYRGRPYKLR